MNHLSITRLHMQTNKQSEYELIMERALYASKMNDSETAIDQFHAAALLEPGKAAPHFLVAAEYMELKKIESAEGAYATAVLLEPSMHIARFQLGLLFATTNRNALALVTWEPLLKLEENNYFRLFVEGFTAILLNDPTKAIHHIERGIKCNQENIPLNLDMNNVLNNLRGQKSESQLKTEDQKSTKTSVVTDADSSNIGNQDISEDPVNHFLLNNYQQQGPLH